MVRTTTKNQINQTNGKSPSKKSKKNDSQSENSSDLSTSSESSSSSRPASVHKQNLYVVSLPIIYFFNFLRFFLYQLFVVIKYIYNATTRILYRPIIKKECEILDEQKNQNIIENSPAEIIEMSTSRGITQGVGPGDPLLAKQKHHHRRAFEYISKALKIDEENEGEFFLFFFVYHFVLKNRHILFIIFVL